MNKKKIKIKCHVPLFELGNVINFKFSHVINVIKAFYRKFAIAKTSGINFFS